MSDEKQPSLCREQNAERIKEIRATRRKAGFTEVTVWMPVELSRWLRDLAWEKVDECGRPFPNRTIGPKARRRRRK